MWSKLTGIIERLLDMGKWVLILLVTLEIVALVGGAGLATHWLWNATTSVDPVIETVTTPSSNEDCVLIGTTEVCPR